MSYIYKDDILYTYLTPATARIAYEQMVAWYRAHDGKDKGDAIPALLSPDNEHNFKAALMKAGIDLKLLEAAGIAQIDRETQHNCGMTNYSRNVETFHINMIALHQLASQPMPPAPQPPKSAAKAFRAKTL